MSKEVKKRPHHRIHSAKNNSSSFGLFPNKQIEELKKALVDLRSDNMTQQDQMYQSKHQALRLISRIAKVLKVSEGFTSD